MFSTYYLKRLFLLSAKFMDDGEPSGKAVTTDESAINGCLENLQGNKLLLEQLFSLPVSIICFNVSSENLVLQQDDIHKFFYFIPFTSLLAKYVP